MLLSRRPTNETKGAGNVKTTRPYELKERIYKLCNDEQYFTAGSNEQYSMMFYATTSPEFTTRDVAVMIWTCSVTAELRKVQEQIEEIFKEIESDTEEEVNEVVCVSE